MRAWCVWGVAAAAALALAAPAVRAEGPMVGHMVYFKLKDRSPEARQKLVGACKKYLSGHPGTVFFAAGVVGDAFDRPVNDRDWDVALHLVFVDQAAHDKYQEAERHLKFIEENRASWEKVRVFDSLIEAGDAETGKRAR